MVHRELSRPSDCKMLNQVTVSVPIMLHIYLFKNQSRVEGRDPSPAKLHSALESARIGCSSLQFSFRQGRPRNIGCAARRTASRCGCVSSSRSGRTEKRTGQQLSLTDPVSRPMTSGGKRTGTVDYNVQTAVDTKHHLIVEHEVTNIGGDHGQLSRMALTAKNGMSKLKLKVLADRR